MDGRAVYNSIFAGVYWEVQQMMLEDIDRIEVIRGPGATVWGANAVNGVTDVNVTALTNYHLKRMNQAFVMNQR